MLEERVRFERRSGQCFPLRLELCKSAGLALGGNVVFHGGLDRGDPYSFAREPASVGTIVAGAPPVPFVTGACHLRGLGVEFNRSISRARPPVVLMGGLNLVRALGMGGVPCLLATGDRQSLSLASRYCSGRLPLPTADGTDAVLKTLRDAGGQLGRSCGGRVPLFYSNDDQLALVQQHRHLLEEHYLLLLNDPGVDHALLDKALFERLARERGLPVPRSLRWDGIGKDSLADFAGPVIVKPHMRKLRGEFKLFDALLAENEKARIFASGREAMAHPMVQQLHPHLAFQEYVHGSGRDIWSFHGVADEKARLLGSFSGP